MSEQVPRTGQTAPITQETLQFSDGQTALYYRTAGDTIEWGGGKYTRGLTERHGRDLAIVRTESGRRFGLGHGVAVMLPEQIDQNGRFIKKPDQQLAAASIVAGLEDVTIGQPWRLVDGDPVESVMVHYRPQEPGDTHNQVTEASPFDHLAEITEAVASHMEAAGQLR